MKSFTLTLFFIATLTITLFAQISNGGTPLSWQKSAQKSTLKAIIIESLPTPKTININKHGSFKFANTIVLNKSTNEIGKWTYLDNGDRLWQVKLKSEGAYSLNVLFSRYLLPKGAELYIYTPNKEHVLGAFTYKNNKTYGSLAVAPITGDEIIIEYYEPADADFNGELTIGTIGHDYLNIFGEKDGQFGKSESCNIDINCTEGNEWQVQKRAVCRMVIDGGTLCTGTLINNTAQNQDPYILSANHCINTQTLANNTVFVFNYESASCDGTDGSVAQSVSGASLVATKNNNNGYLDFTLLKLSSNVPLSYKPYFAGWNNSTTIPNKTTCIHHPNGDVKKISHDFDASEISDGDNWGYDPNSFWKINSWDKGTTEGGSSGCPLFNENKHIIGTLTGGGAGCSNPNGSDFFQIFSFSYDKYSADSTQLKHWLDPINSGISILDGYDTSPTAIQTPKYKSIINIYPTLATHEITIDFDNKTPNNIDIIIYNNIGKAIVKNSYSPQTKIVTLNVSNLQKGFYLISVNTDTKTYTRKFIKM